MPIVHECSSPDCETLTIGEFCLACEERLRGGKPDIVEDLNAAARGQRHADNEPPRP